MIIIDEAAEDKLAQALRGLDDPQGRYCIHLQPEGGDRERIRQTTIARAQACLPGADIYFCEDGEIFLLAHAPVKECKKAFLDIAEALDAQPVEKRAELYEVGLQLRLLLAMLDRKTEQRLRAQAELAYVQDARKIAARRRKILEDDSLSGAECIAEKRVAREQAELMIVEDDPFSRRLVKNVLGKQYSLTEFATAEGVLAAYTELAPDVLFLDINLPDVTGHELLEKLITLDPQAYIVMLSGNADRTNVTQATGLGAKGFVAKPFSHEKLLQYVERCPTIVKENRI